MEVSSDHRLSRTSLDLTAALMSFFVGAQAGTPWKPKRPLIPGPESSDTLAPQAVRPCSHTPGTLGLLCLSHSHTRKDQLPLETGLRLSQLGKI